MNIKKVEEVVRLMEKHNLNEISIEEEGLKIHLRKGPGGEILEKAVRMQSPVLTPHVETAAQAPPAKNGRNTVEITSPMVGTFYRAPAPDAKSFTDVGKTIKVGDVLCIIEAMKLMNEIKSEIKGKIVDILVENGAPIEFGQALFVVEPS